MTFCRRCTNCIPKPAWTLRGRKPERSPSVIRSPALRKGELVPAGPERPEYVPGLLVVRVKPDVVANVPDIRSTSAAKLRAFRFESAIDQPLQYLQRQRVFREVLPLFARKKDVGKKTLTGMPAAAALAAGRGPTVKAEAPPRLPARSGPKQESPQKQRYEIWRQRSRCRVPVFVGHRRHTKHRLHRAAGPQVHRQGRRRTRYRGI